MPPTSRAAVRLLVPHARQRVLWRCHTTSPCPILCDVHVYGEADVRSCIAAMAKKEKR